MKKTFYERYASEILSDNSNSDHCKQCKDCVLRSDGTVWSNNHQKTCCIIFQYPDHKPRHVIFNEGYCDYYKKESKGV